MLRPGPRKLRILLDDDSLDGPENQHHKMFDALLGYQGVEPTTVSMKKISEPPPMGSPNPRNEVLVLDTTKSKGTFSYPGPAFGYRVFDSDGDLRSAGNLSPGVQLEQSYFARLYPDAPREAPTLPKADEDRAVLLAEIARAVHADIVVSETSAIGDPKLYAYHRANTFSRAQCIPLIAHYLRIQHIYVTDPRRHRTINRRGFYQESVAALAPRIWHWLAKCQNASMFLPHATAYLDECRAMIGRLLRALKVKDELIYYLGSYQNHEVMDDAADCMDRILVSLCGAVDIMARSVHNALQVPGNNFNAKLHNTDWYTKKFRPTYERASGIDVLDDMQAMLSVVFELRNTIHSLALEAMGSIGPTVNFFQQDRGRLNVLIPERSAATMRKTTGGLESWGARQVGSDVVADAATMIETCLEVVFSFLDQLCAIISFEQIWDKDQVLQQNVISAEAMLKPDALEVVRVLLGANE
ncbi:hypothetical protein SAMN05421642_12426 [Rhodococcoides kyotonense]|uniref:Uncharacterized protein n=2 Tax=Rhodococcoides kyotonense TaxID=398843 RepID=A0A239MXT3_9NOCA|nr:hypothetical protein SAMN05421642_12426 [Rhodococcus kyotonensis]